MKPFYFLLLICLLAPIARAEANFLGKEGGGGDLCEDQIQTIRDDISSWIKNGGPANGLRLPQAVTVADYSSRMLDVIASSRISCVKPGDDGFPVTVGHTPKVCRFDHGTSLQITCDYNSFMNPQVISESNQYVLIHHEYAGLAGIENPDGDISNYETSNQLTAYLQDKLVKKLSIKKAPPSPFSFNYAGTSQSGSAYIQVTKKLDEDNSPHFEVQLRLNGSFSAIIFQAVEWDPKNSALKAEQVEDRTGGIFRNTLVCWNINLEGPNIRFTCGYYGGLDSEKTRQQTIYNFVKDEIF